RRHTRSKRDWSSDVCSSDLTRISAPVDGIVARRSVQVGQYVAPGQELLSIVQIDNIWVTANFKETQLKNMRTGQPVVIHVDTYRSEERRVGKECKAQARPIE